MKRRSFLKGLGALVLAPFAPKADNLRVVSGIREADLDETARFLHRAQEHQGNFGLLSVKREGSEAKWP